MSTNVDKFLYESTGNIPEKREPHQQVEPEHDDDSGQIPLSVDGQDDIGKYLEGLPEHIASRIRLKLFEKHESEKDLPSISSGKKSIGPNPQLMKKRTSLRTVLGGMSNGRRVSAHSKANESHHSEFSDADSDSSSSRYGDFKQSKKKNSVTKLIRRKSSIRLVPGENSKEDVIPHYRRASQLFADSSKSSVMSSSTPDLLAPIIAPTKASSDNYIYDIDSVGVASYQVSNLYILQRRSLPASRNHQLTGGNGVRGGLVPVQSHSMLLPSQQGLSVSLSKSYSKSIALLKSKTRSTFAGRDSDKKGVLASSFNAASAAGAESREGSHLAYEFQKQVNDMSETILNQMASDRKYRSIGSTDILMPYYSRAQAYERMKKVS